MISRIIFFLTLLLSISANAQPLLFISEVAGRADLYRCEEDGSGLQRITDTPDYELMAVVSRDGKNFAYAASPFKEGKFQPAQIFVTDWQGKSIRQITNNQQLNFSPAFSPDGKKIAYSSLTANNNSDIYIVDIDGKNLRQMTASPAFEANPAWGEIGATLLFQGWNDGSESIMRMNVNGTSTFAALERGDSFSPSWGTGEKTFIYGIVAAQAFATDFILADQQGQTLQRLPGKKDIRTHPHLSADGKKYVYEQNKIETSGVFVSDLNGENIIEIGHKEDHNFAPVWISETNVQQLEKRQSTLKRELNDDAGNLIAIDLELLPQKVVSLSPALTEVIFALGETKRLKGVTLRATYPPAAKLITQVGSYGDPDWEKIEQIAPEYVFLSTSLQKKYIPRIKELGATPILFTPENIEGTFSSFIKISLILSGSSESAEKLIRLIKGRMAELAKIVKKVEKPRRVYMEINGPKNLYTVGQSSFMNDLMKQAGVINVFGLHNESYPKITDTDVISADPDVIIIDHPLQFKKGLKKRAGWQSIKAVKNDKVFDAQDFDTLILDRPGPRIAEAIEIIARLTYPEIFSP